jgi:HSP20 family molecular chaperone IbpA
MIDNRCQPTTQENLKMNRSLPTLTGLSLIAVLGTSVAQMPAPFAPPFPPGANFAMTQGIDIETRQDDKGYYLIIHTRGITPERVKVDTRGNSISIEAGNEQSRKVTRNDPGAGDSRQSYSYYSYSSSSSRISRRLNLPADADTGKVVREDGKDQVTVFIPKKAD